MATTPPSKRVNAQLFNPKVMDRTIVAIPLLRQMDDTGKVEQWLGARPPAAVKGYNTIVFLSRNYPEGMRAALLQIKELLTQILADLGLSPSKNKFLQAAPGTGQNRQFVVAKLERTVRLALLDRDRKGSYRAIERAVGTCFEVIIDVNLHYPHGRLKARAWLVDTIKALVGKRERSSETGLKHEHAGDGQYIFARMCKEDIEDLLDADTKHSVEVAKELNKGKSDSSTKNESVSLETCRIIHSIWPDFPIKPCITQSIATVKADAALNSFTTVGTGITWAVIDSGIDGDHPHFQQNQNINRNSPLHRDFTSSDEAAQSPLRDAFGHGSHVAGIIAGGYDKDRDSKKENLKAVRRVRINPGAQESDVKKIPVDVPLIRGMAPKCELISLKVLNDVGYGEVSNVIAALSYVLDVNNSGRAELRIHGVNISLGYEIEPEWFACGESPICIEVNRVVRSGVVVVVAAGNTGHGTVASEERSTSAGLDMTINDPGNAELAITVGSTHRDMPHRYGVSYFSSKGPTGDGRAKPDLVAPGEKILSCATGGLLRDRVGSGANQGLGKIDYVEDSGTSMAAPHVSGIIAGFLSVRREFIGKPEDVKNIFCSTAIDLKRDRYFQGAGLADLMRAIQSV